MIVVRYKANIFWYAMLYSRIPIGENKISIITKRQAIVFRHLLTKKIASASSLKHVQDLQAQIHDILRITDHTHTQRYIFK